MALSVNTPSCGLLSLEKLRPGQVQRLWPSSSSSSLLLNRGKVGTKVQASLCPFNPGDLPILKEALKEPVAFMGGMFAGLLRLDLNEEPLKEWVTRTVEASGITEEEIEAEGSKPGEEVPEQIEIE